VSEPVSGTPASAAEHGDAKTDTFHVDPLHVATQLEPLQ
jgi:hypothetical protein